jgi:hypothetical protein
VAEASDQEAMSPQIPADAPDWFAKDGLEEEPAASAPADEDAEILDEFESALSDGLTLSLDEMSAEETAQPEPEYEEPAPFEAPEDDVAAFEAQQEEAVAFEAPQEEGVEFEAPPEEGMEFEAPQEETAVAFEALQEEVAAFEPPEEDVASYDEMPGEEAVADEATREEVASYEALREEIGSFEPAAEPAEAKVEEPFEFDLDLDEEVEVETPEPVAAETEIDEEAVLDDIEMMAEELGADLGADNPPFLETAEMPAGDMETMQPLDLPELPEVEETRSAAVDIERELDAALSGYDQYDSGQRDREPTPAMSQAAAATAAAADTRLDFDMGAFEDDLARDLEFVDHDMSAKDGSEDFGATEENAPVVGMSAPAAAPQKPKRGMMIAAVVGGIAIIGAIAAFSLTGRETGGDGAPVLVKADPDPVKVVPEDPGGKQVPNQDRAVYGEVDGITETQPSQESLVSTSEEPIDLTGAGSEALPNGVTEAGKGEDRLLPESAEATGPAVSTESPTALLTPRRVRTVIVKPDGSFIETGQPEAPAVAETTPAEPQTPPAGSAAETIRKIDMAPAPARLEPPAAQTETATAAPQPADTAETSVEMTPAENAALETLATASEPQAAETAAEPPAGETVATAPRAQPLRTPTSIPERPVDQPVNIVNPQQTQTARATEPAQVPTQQTSSGYSVQIASQPSAELAQQTAQNLSRRYSDILGGRAITIQTAEIEGRGTFHRVRVAATSRQDAVALCEAYKRAGGSCFVAR